MASHDPWRPKETPYFGDSHAAYQPPPPRSSGWKTLLTIVLLVAGCGVFAAIAGTFVYLARFKNPPPQVASLRTTAELQAESSQAFQNFASQETIEARAQSSREWRSVEALLRRLEAAAKSEDLPALAALLDFDRFLQRMDQTGALTGWTSRDRRELKKQLQDELEPERQWERLTAVAVIQRPEEPELRTVYALGWTEDEGDEAEWRLWLAPSESGWALYDWERLDTGMSEARRWSVYAQYADGSQLDGVYRWSDAINQAARLVDSDREAAYAALRRAEASSFPSEMADYCLLFTGYHWQGFGQMDDAKRCYERVRNPDQTPGAYYGLMNCAEGRDPPEALEHAARYESLVGPSPQLCRTKARVLERLGDKDAAAAEWRKIASMQPDDTEALGELLILLPPEKKPEFFTRLDSLANPVAAADELANSIGYRDYDGLMLLVEYVQAKSPNSPRAARLQGFAAERDGDYERAAEFYRQAFTSETDEDSGAEYVYNYLDAMAMAGRGVEAYRDAPDPVDAFEYLVSGYEDGEASISTKEFEELVALHRQLQPEDPWGAYYAAILAVEEEQYADAEQIVREALSPEVDEDTRSLLNDQLAVALFHLQRGTEAYETLPPQDERFSQLANLAIFNDQWETLPALIELHRAANPQDPELEYAAGQIAEHEKRWDDAASHYVRGKELAEEEYLKSRFQSLLRAAAMESGGWADFFQASDEFEDDFTYFARAFTEGHDWDSLEKLFQLHRARGGDPQSLAHRDVEALWELGAYAEFADRARPVIEAGAKDDASWEFRSLADRRFAALLRLARWDDAQAVAQEQYDEEQDATWLAVVAAARGDSAAAQKFAEASLEADASGRSLYHHSDGGALFLDEEFAALHERHPPTLPYVVSETVAVFLLTEPLALDGETLTAAAGAAGGAEAAPWTVANAARTDASSWAIRHNGASVWFVAGEGVFDEAWINGDRAAPLQEAIANSQGWLAVGVAAWNDRDREAAVGFAERLGVNLAGSRAVAVYVEDQFRIFPADEDVLAALEAGESLNPFDDRSIQPDFEEEEYDAAERHKFNRSLREALRSGDDGAPLKILVHLGEDPLTEPLWLDVRQSRRAYGGFELDCVAQQPSSLLPELRSGLPLRIEQYEVQQWRQ
jgi:hypothetical protein